MPTIVRDPAMLPLAILLFLTGVVRWKYQPRPAFVVPPFYIRSGRQLFLKTTVFFVIVLVSLLPLNLALSSPQQTTSQPTLNVQLLFDVSISMAATDILPSRFAASQEALLSLIQSLDGYWLSLISFAGKSFVELPFSDNNAAFAQAFSRISFADYPPTDEFQGTAIGDALLLAIDNLRLQSNVSEHSGAIILLTDGDANVGADPHDALAIAKSLGIPIFTLGIGKENFVLGLTHSNVQIESRLDTKLLETLAQESGGDFFMINEEHDFSTVFESIAQTIQSQERTIVTHHFFYLNRLIMGLILAGALFLLYVRRASDKKARFA